ncbi:MAG: hypothetical protein R6W82_01230 [bacterium]
MKRLLMALPILTLLAACGEGTLFTRSMEEGVAVLTYHRYEPPATDPYRVEPGPVLGAAQGADTYLLGAAEVAGITPDGLVIVDDRREGRIHRFSLDGSHLGAFGRRGSGPGELGSRYHVTFVDSTDITVYAEGRLLSFAHDGTYRKEWRPDPGIPLNRMMNAFQHPVPLEGKSGYISPARRFVAPRAGEEEGRYTIQLQVLDGSFARVTSVVDTTLVRRMIWLPGNYGVPAPFQEDLLFGIAPWQPLAWNWSPEEDRIDFLDTGTMTRSAVVIPWTREPVREADREEVFNRYRGEQEAVARERIRVPDRLPAIGPMMWDGTGRLWVFHYQGAEAEEAGEPRLATVLDREGRWLFDQHLPVEPDRIEGDLFFKNTEDEQGQPVAEVYRLVER